MPALPSSRHALLAGGNVGGYSEATENTEMIDAGNVNAGSTIQVTSNNNSHRTIAPVVAVPSCPPDKNSSETDTKNFRNRANTKVKLLVRSHAMRESTSPPREPHNNNGGSSPMSPHSPQSLDGGDKKFTNTGTGGLSPNTAGSTSPKINNNESIYNSNLGNGQSPKQTRNTATSPTCRTSSRNGQSSPCQALSPKNVNSTSSTSNNRNDNGVINHRGKLTTGSASLTSNNSTSQSTKCNNCVKNNHNERPGLLQTPPSPTKLGQALQHSPKSTNLAQTGQNCQQGRLSESRRPNTLNVCNNQCSAQCGNTLSVSRPGSRHKLRHQNSSQGSLDSGASPCLSRDSSTELYTDSTGIDLEQFIAVTINRNQKDRTVLLRIEKDLIEFAKDRQKVCHKFPNMSSYNRMLVHRVAAYFGMEHNVDQSGLSVIVTRTKNMRIPDTRFKEHIRDDLILTEEPRRSILKRDSSSFEDSFNIRSPDRLSGGYCRRSKSFEEREEEYERARRRIFKDSSGESSEVTSWPYWSSSESSDNSARYRLLHPSDHSIRPTRLAKGESFDGRDSYRTGVLRPSVSKSFSFGGYTRGMLSRGDSVTSTHSAGARLTKQDSGASMCSRLSPSSSGYKSQSQRSDATISPSPSPSPIPTLPCALHAQSSQNSGGSPEPRSGQTVMWAVTSISSVPPGSIIMNPRTNQPYTNSDGTIYRFDPENPPKIFTELHEDIVESIAEVETESDIVTAPPTPSQNHQKRDESLHRQEQTRNNNKCENKRQRCHSKSTNSSNNNNNNNGVAISVASVVGISSQSRVTNSATSPTLPFAPSPPIQAQQPSQQPSQPPQQQQQQSTHQPQQIQECGQSLLKTVATSQSNVVATCPHAPNSQPTYVGYPHSGPEAAYGQPVVYGPANAVQQSGGLLVARHPGDVSGGGQHQGQQNNAPPPDMVFGQGPVYGNYSMGIPQSPMQQSNDVSDLSGYFMGMNVYEQPRNGGEAQTTPTHHAYSQPPPSAGASAAQQTPPAGNQSLQSVQGMQTNYWHPPPNHQMPPQQAMYFVPPSGAALAVGQQNERQQQHQQQQQQRFATSYSFNGQTMTPPNQNTTNYVNSYPVPYNTVPAVAAATGTEYAYQPPVHMIPTYYPPGQPGIQPPPVMWRVPTPPNTPTSNQVGLQMPAGVPLMYVNSGSYATAPPAMLSTGTFGHHHHHHPHQVAGTGNGTSPAPPGAYMTPAIVPNIVFRQNVPVVAAGIRASTPAGSQRASRSPTPGHEIFGPAGVGLAGGNNGCPTGSGDNRNAQAQQRYPLPMYQGLHIVQGDMRLMHPGVPNPRLQYAPVSSPPVVQGCPRPFRPPSYSSNTSGCPTPNSYDGRNQKIRKQRSKVTTLPPSGPRPNVYQAPSMPSLSSNAPKDIREGTVKVTITRRNQLVQY